RGSCRPWAGASLDSSLALEGKFRSLRQHRHSLGCCMVSVVSGRSLRAPRRKLTGASFDSGAFSGDDDRGIAPTTASLEASDDRLEPVRHLRDVFRLWL